MSKNEYKGGFYVFFEFVGLYVRFFICKVFQINKSIVELSGEKDYPLIDKKERLKCLIIGIIVVSITIISVLSIFN